MKRKILVTTGTRAEYGILRPVLQSIKASKKLELFLVVTGTHLSKKYGTTINEIKKDGFKVSATIDLIPKEDANYFMSKAIGDGIVAFSKIFRKLKPDINLILGDRYEMLASAIAAYHMNIPNAHIHGGDKSGGIDEYTRHAITKISNIHFVVTGGSKERVIKMGEDPKYVFLTGSPSVDEIASKKITSKKELEKKYGISFTGNEILLVQHPVTTESEKSGKQIRHILDAVVKINNTTIAIAPNSDSGNQKIFDHLKKYSQKHSFIKVYPTLPRSDYLGMMKNCGVLLGNSSSGMIEASYFNIPVINVGNRQQGRERGRNVIDVTNDSTKAIYISVLDALKRKKHQRFKKEYIYGKGDAAKRIVRYLEFIPLGKELIEKRISY